MTRFKFLPTSTMALAFTATVMMLINLSLAMTNDRESFDLQPMFKRAMVQAHGGNQVVSSSGSITHAATGPSSSTDNASAGGMHGKWPNGLDGKPKDLQEYHRSLRATYERPSGGLSQGRNLRTRYSDQGDIKPVETPPNVGQTGSEKPGPVHSRDRWPDEHWPSSSSPASAPLPKHGRERLPDEPFPPPSKGGNGRKLLNSKKSRLRPKSGSMNKRSLQSFAVQGTGTLAKRSVTSSGASTAGSSGGVANYSGTNVHSAPQASPSDLTGRWPNGESGRPIHPNERTLFNLYVQPPNPQYRIGSPSAPLPHFKNQAPSPAPADSPSSSPAPAPSPRHGRERLPDEPGPGNYVPHPPLKSEPGRQLSGSGKSRLRAKKGPNTKRSLHAYTGEETDPMVKRSVVPAGGPTAGGGGGGVVGYSGTNVHSTSQSGHYGKWANGEGGRPIHPNERTLFNPYVEPPNSQYHIVEPPPGSLPHFTNQTSSGSPASAPSPSGRRLLNENKPSRKSRLRTKT